MNDFNHLRNQKMIKFKNLTQSKYKIISSQSVNSKNSIMNIFEKKKLFLVKRCFILSKLKANEMRGNHAHKECHQFIISINGLIKIELIYKNKIKNITLNDSSEGLHVPPYHWIKIKNFKKNNSILVLCSHNYNENEYIRDFDDFKKICS